MIRGRRRHAKSRSRQNKKTGDAKEKANVKEDITSYLTVATKGGVLREASPPLPEVSVPSPDDAALPKPSLSSLNEKQLKHTGDVLDDTLPSSPKKGSSEKPLCNGELSVLPMCNGFHLSEVSDKEEQENKCLTLLMSSTSLGKRRQRKNDNQLKNHQLTEYFPVRRSNRKTLCSVKREKQKMLEEAILSGKEDGFEVKEFPEKGRGVVTTKNLKRGDFVLEYAGELINFDEAKKREARYATKESTGCYMYYFKFGNKQYCVDATKESGRLGRLVNHSKKGNLKTQSFLVKNVPHLILVACRDISPGEELLYDYGDRSKKSIESHPWLAM